MITISLLGPTNISGGGQLLTARDLGGVKPRQLLEMLALEPGRAVTKDVLAERLWEGRPPAGYLGTIESYVCVVRRRLRPLTRGAAAVHTSHGGYVLDPQQAHVDVAEVRELLPGDEADVCRALDLATGDLLADEPYASWAEDAREEFTQQLGQACLGAARAANARACPTAATRLAREAAARCPYSEAALRELMSALAATGARAEAIRVYEEARARFTTDLGLGLGPETRRLFLGILRADDAAARATNRAELATMLRLIHHALSADPSALAGLPWSRELGHLLRQLPA